MNDHDCIQGPFEGMIHAGVTDLSSYLNAHRKVVGERAEESEDQRRAYVNHGRWVVDCSKCKGAGLASREKRVSCCFDCGRIYTSVTFPRNASKIEAALLKRSDPATRNWTTGETMKSLDAENESHGIE
jgi:hypothetical protein